MSVSATIDSSKILIGEQIQIHLSVKQDDKLVVHFPKITKTIVEGIEVINVSKPDTVKLGSGLIQITEHITITSFDSAQYYIPPFKFSINGADTMETSPLSLMVNTVKVNASKNNIYDIKPIYKAKLDWGEVIFWIVLTLIVIGIIVSIVLYVLHRRNKTDGQKEEIVVNPLETAIKALDQIKAEKIWRQGKVKEFYTDVTMVLRQYIKNRYKIDALEMTSDEILDSLKKIKADEAAESSIKQILMVSDLVKFAKWTPSFNDNDAMLDNAYDFVNRTKEAFVEMQKEEQ